MSYSAKTLSSLLKFVTVDGNDTESADEVTITTHKEEKENISKKPTIHLTPSELAQWEEKHLCVHGRRVGKGRKQNRCENG